MLDSHSLAEYSSQVLNASGNTELEQRLGLYRVFLKLYEHHRSLLDEILDLGKYWDAVTQAGGFAIRAGSHSGAACLRDHQSAQW